MLLSLFTRDTAGKSIADFIISFSELLASVRACKLLFICNILSPAPACRTLRKGRRPSFIRLASAGAEGALPSLRDGVPSAPRRSMWPRPTRVFRSSKAPRGGLADPGQAGHDAGADPALGDRVFALPEQRTSIVDRMEQRPAQGENRIFRPERRRAGQRPLRLLRWRHSARSATARHGRRRSMPSTPAEP